MSEKVYEYPGKEAIVRWDQGVCTHAGACVKGLPAVFDIQRKPWIEVDQASAAEVEAQVGKCPSGALSFERR